MLPYIAYMDPMGIENGDVQTFMYVDQRVHQKEAIAVTNCDQNGG